MTGLAHLPARILNIRSADAQSVEPIRHVPPLTPRRNLAASGLSDLIHPRAPRQPRRIDLTTRRRIS